MEHELKTLQAWLARAKTTQGRYAGFDAGRRNDVLERVQRALSDARGDIFLANARDVTAAEAQGITGALAKRLVLDATKLESLLDGISTLLTLSDPLGQGLGRRVLPNGLYLEPVRVPLGVIGLIYESRPGVTVETTGLTLKSGNALLLRGGHEALQTNGALVAVIREALGHFDLEDLVQFIDDPDRAWVSALMHLDGLDLLIPRGGAELIRRVNREAAVPVIETGVGNCHVYVDRMADLEMAVRVVRDAKMGNPAVCNAAETLLVHREVAPVFLPRLETALEAHGVRFHADDEAARCLQHWVAATEEDFYEEYLDLDLAVAVVPDVGAAIDHINRYGSKHSEAIVTEDYRAGSTFQTGVDAAVVYWNASTRFTDGFQFGLGAEVGISTQKLHARGPMGLEALTTLKTLVWGQGQTRDIP